MSITPTSGTGATTAAVAAAQASQTTGAVAQKGLGQDAFLKLLVTQLEHQDPSQPKNDTEFIAQLATFSQLEKLTEIAISVQKLTTLLSQQAPVGPDAAGSTNQATQGATSA